MDDCLFLSGLDTYHIRPFFGSRLRAYIMMHSLFYDKLLVTDSLMNNNPSLRYLLWPDEPGKGDSCPRDLAELLSGGFLLPALRLGQRSLKDLRAEHAGRNVDGLPSLGYVEFVEEHLQQKYIPYDPVEVSRKFKERALEAFSSVKNHGPGKLSIRVQKQVHGWICNQEPLLYDQLRKWLRREESEKRITHREYGLIDKMVSTAYAFNVPLSLKTNIDIPVSYRKYPLPVALDLGHRNRHRFPEGLLFLEQPAVLPQVGFLSMNFLAKMPASLYKWIKGSKEDRIPPLPSYRKISVMLSDFRSGKPVNIAGFSDQLTTYFFEVGRMVMECLTRGQLEDYLNWKNQKSNEMRIQIFENTLMTIIGCVPVIGNITNGIQTFFTSFGKISELRSESYMKDYRDGYISGCLGMKEHLFSPPGQIGVSL